METRVELSRGPGSRQVWVQACVQPELATQGLTADCSSAVLQEASDVSFNFQQTAVCGLQEAL